MLDCYIHGFANNLNSRDSVDDAEKPRGKKMLEAAAHVVDMSQWDLKVKLFGIIGDDRAGISTNSWKKKVYQLMGDGIVEGRKTTVKTRLLATTEFSAREQILLRWDIEDDEIISEDAISAIYEQAILQLDDSFTVILSDYGQGVVNDEGVEKDNRNQRNQKTSIIADRTTDFIEPMESVG